MPKARKIMLVVATALVVAGCALCFAAWAAAGFDMMGLSTSTERFEIVVYDDRDYRQPGTPTTPEAPEAPGAPEAPAAPETPAAPEAPEAPTAPAAEAA